MRMGRTAIILLGLVAFALVPLLAGVTGNSAMEGLATRIVIYAIAAVSLDLIIGYGALVSFGHAMFFGLGGYMVGDVDASRGGYELNSAADRIVETMRLARLYPQAKIVVSGGAGAFFAASARDADSTRTLLHDLGFSGDRYIFENRSRNTVENARYSMALAQPKPGETWLLVTSAYHMPRAVGCFRAAGFRVTAWPVDYKTRAHEGLSFDLDAPDDALSRLDVAVREWIGLAAYRLAGKTGALLPGP